MHGRDSSDDPTVQIMQRRFDIGQLHGYNALSRLETVSYRLQQVDPAEDIFSVSLHKLLLPPNKSNVCCRICLQLLTDTVQ